MVAGGLRGTELPRELRDIIFRMGTNLLEGERRGFR